jgi:hypothetical protein
MTSSGIFTLPSEGHMYFNKSPPVFMLQVDIVAVGVGVSVKVEVKVGVKV